MTDGSTPLGGSCEARFDRLREVFAACLASGEDLGASLAVNIDGEMVVDLWGGWTDEARSKRWTQDTIVNVYSTTKTVTALAALVLVEQGELDLDASVARYWPEFAAKGKEEVKIRHLLAHTSGVSGWDQPITVEELYDWEKSTALLAMQAPFWEPGTASGYHGVTYGHLIGEVIRRITGQRLGEFLAAQVVGRLGTDFYIGLPLDKFQRVANVVPPPSSPHDANTLDPESVAFKSLFNPMLRAELSWTEAWRRAEIGASNGHGNARSLARLQSAVACGGAVDGVRFLSEKTLGRIFELQYDGIDQVLGTHVRMGIGYGKVPFPALLPFLPEGRIAAWGGWGGSLVMADADRGMTFAYAMNKMASTSPGPIATALVESLYEIVGR
jgi:CubicO group peptidase (beta-lactamase class C family)